MRSVPRSSPALGKLLFAETVCHQLGPSRALEIPGDLTLGVQETLLPFLLFSKPVLSHGKVLALRKSCTENLNVQLEMRNVQKNCNTGMLLKCADLWSVKVN